MASIAGMIFPYLTSDIFATFICQDENIHINMKSHPVYLYLCLQSCVVVPPFSNDILFMFVLVLSSNLKR